MHDPRSRSRSRVLESHWRRVDRQSRNGLILPLWITVIWYFDFYVLFYCTVYATWVAQVIYVYILSDNHVHQFVRVHRSAVWCSRTSDSIENSTLCFFVLLMNDKRDYRGVLEYLFRYLANNFNNKIIWLHSATNYQLRKFLLSNDCKFVIIICIYFPH